MNMLSSHRIRPSIVSGFTDHGLDQSSLNTPSHLMISDRGNISSDRTNSMSIDRPSMLNDRVNFTNERSSFINERSNFVNERTSFTNERSSFLNDRSRIPCDRPSMLNDRPNTTVDRANVTNERSMSNQRTNYSNERKSISSDRRSMPNGCHKSDERSYAPDSRPTVSTDRPIDRPTISFDRPTDRPTISIDNPTDRNNMSSERPNITSDRGRQSKSPHNPNNVTMATDRQPIHPTSYSKTTIFRGDILRGPNDDQSHPDPREYNGRFEGQRNAHPAEISNDNTEENNIQARNLLDNSHTRHPYHMHPSIMTRNKSPKLSENHTQIFSNYSMVSTNSVRPIMVPTTEHLTEHIGSQRYDKTRWKSYNFIDKSGEYLTTSSVTKNDSPGKQVYTIPHTHSSMPPFSHTNISDQLPSYNSFLRDKVSMSPSNVSYVDDADNNMYIEKADIREESRQSDKQHKASRSPTNMPDESVSKPELIRKSYMSQDSGNNSNGRSHFPVKSSIFSRVSPERYALPDHPVSKSSYSPHNSDKTLPPDMSVSMEQNTTSNRAQAVPYARTVPERPSMLSDKSSTLPENNSGSPRMPSVSTQNHLRLSDKHSMLPEKARVLPTVMVNGHPRLPDNYPTMSGIQPLYSDNINTNNDTPNTSERMTSPHNISVSSARSTTNPPPPISMQQDRPPVASEGATILTDGKKSVYDTEAMKPIKSLPTLLNTPITSTVHSSGNLSPNNYLINECASAEQSLQSSPRSHVDTTPNFNELSEGEEEGDENPTSPVPHVVILNPDDASSDVASSCERSDHENDNNTLPEHEERRVNGHSPISVREHPVLSSERPSMLSDSPSMVSAISVRPSMVNSDCNENMTDPSGLTSPTDKPNVIKRGKRKKYQKYTPADRIAIGKFCFEHGPAAARKAFQSRYPEMSESVTRGFRDKYKLMIGEYAVYVFEQKRRREMHVRTESLPRGRPRKYKQIEADEKPSLAPVSVSPPFQTTSEPPKHISNDNVNDENDVEDQQKPVLSKDYTRDEKLLIGWFCAKHGGDIALNVFSEEHPDLTLEMVVSFHKMYIESEGQMADKDKSDVFVVETENNTVQSSPSSNGSISTSQPDAKENGGSSPNESSEMISSVSAENGKSEQEFDFISKPDDVMSSNSEIVDTVSPVTSPARPVVPVSPHTLTPIIHYPKISSEGALRVHQHLEQREFKQEYNTKMEPSGETMGYPYDRQLYLYSEDGMTNGCSSLPRTKRFKYQKYSPEDRYNIGKLCNDIGLGATVKVYREQFPRLNESVVRTFRNKYRELLQKGNGVPVAEAIQRKPSRRSITTLIESEVVSQLRQFKLSNIEITEKLVIAVAENIIATKDQKDIGPVKNTVTKEWASSLLWKHKLVERQVSNPNGVCCERCKTPLVCPKC